MTVEQLRWLVAYNRWANARLLQAAAGLSVEELERDLRASFGSLQGTLIHILWGERGWLQFWQVGAFVPEPILNHSTHHRGQVTLLLRQLGHVPPSTDYHDFLTEARAGIA